MATFYFENTPHGLRRDGSKLNTRTHAAYICRQEEYAHMKNRQEDFVLSCSGNLPAWADNEMDFWEKAEENRRTNGRAYRELRFALQEELTLEENQQLIEDFIKQTGIKDSHAYTYAIHDKISAFDDDHRNIHCHLMFNEKIIEKDRPLSADLYFKNYAEDRSGQPSKGYRTNEYWARKSTTLELRQLWAEMCNERFARKKLNCRVSEKSLARQREELLEAGKTEEAELFDRQPAPHLGNAYRSPESLKRIKERIQEIDKLSRTDEDDENINERSSDNDESRTNGNSGQLRLHSAEEGQRSYTDFGEDEGKTIYREFTEQPSLSDLPRFGMDNENKRTGMLLPSSEVNSLAKLQSIKMRNTSMFGKEYATGKKKIKTIKDLRESLETESKKEKMIVVFAADFCLRRVAKEIQKERELLRIEEAKIRAENEAAEQFEEERTAPYVITAADIMEYTVIQETKLRAEKREAYRKYQQAKKAVLPLDKLRLAAYNEANGGKYAETVKQYRKTVKAIQTDEAELATVSALRNSEKYADIFSRLNTNKSLRTSLFFAMKRMQKEAQNETDALFLASLEKVQSENALRESKVNETSKEYKRVLSQLLTNTRLRTELTKITPDSVLFDDYIGSVVKRSTKIRGTKPVKDLITLDFQGKSYALFSFDKTGEKAFAVCLGDRIFKGKANVYKVDLSKGKPIPNAPKEFTWKISKVTQIRTMDNKEYQVPLYDRRKSAKNQGTSQGGGGLSEAQKLRNLEISKNTKKLAETMLSNLENNGKVVVKWQSETLGDKAIQQEQQLYKGWSL